MAKNIVQFTIRELKRECIIMGIPFEHVSDGVPELGGWLDKLAGNKRDVRRLKEYDDWITQIILVGKQAKDANSLLHDDLMFSKQEIEEKEVKKAKKIKKEKKPRAEKDEFGFRKGTKKSRVAELLNKGLSLKMIKKRMIKEFGEVNDQSLKIWIKKTQNLIDEKK